MCGIIGAISTQDVRPILLEGLRRLEYRGYDSAGVAVIDDEGILRRVRTEGKVQILADALDRDGLSGCIGIAHTRWATHGRPAEHNAHPHLSSDVAIVHNGIIENHNALRQYLTDLGYVFSSETDSEVVAHLIHYHHQSLQDLTRAVQVAASALIGSFSLGVMHQSFPEVLVAIRRGSPLVVGLGKDGTYLASDPLALRSFAQEIFFLNEGDSVVLTAQKAIVFDIQGHEVQRPIQRLNDDFYTVSKEPYRHFMLKEIFEQSVVMTETLSGRLSSVAGLRASFGERALTLFQQVKRIHIVACGTSYHAGLVAKYWFESLAQVTTQVEIASEYRYRHVVVDPDTLFIAISQSGETADTLAALSKAKTSGYIGTFAICNVASSSLVRETDCTFLTRAGVEIGVASTKAFTTQLAALLMMATVLCQDERATEVLSQLQRLPESCELALKLNDQIEALSHHFVNKNNALFLGRGTHYPVALEGALKLKEISYIHAEAYPAGELKHGPLALVDKMMPVVVVAPNNELLDKLKSNLHEVSARGGELFVFIDDTHAWSERQATFIPVPACGAWIAPIIYTIPLQLLAYHVAVAKGTDVDQPRNLAKSVTVE